MGLHDDLAETRGHHWAMNLYDSLRRRLDFDLCTENETDEDFRYIEDTLSLRPNSRILDLCCATGRHALALAASGHKVRGLDINRQYLAEASAQASIRGIEVDFQCADIRTAEYGLGYDAIISMFHSFGFFGDAEDLAVLAKIHKALAPNGRFLIELLNRDWVLLNFESTSTRSAGGVVAVESRAFDPLTSKMEFVVQYLQPEGGAQRRGSWRLYSPHELRFMAESVGFRLILAHGRRDKSPLEQDSALIRLIFSKGVE